MKSLLVIPIAVALLVGAGMLVLSGHGMKPVDPLTAGVIGAAAGILGWLPMVVFKVNGAVEVTQLALIGTIIHLGSAVAMTIVALKTNVVGVQGPFVFWLMAAYGVSLVTLIWQLRQRLLSAAGAASEPQVLPAAKVKG